MSLSAIVKSSFPNCKEWEARMSSLELNPTINFLGGVSVTLPGGSSVSLETLASHVNFLYKNLVDFYDLKSDARYSKQLRAKERMQAILGLRQITVLYKKATENHGLVQKIYYVFIGLFRSLLLLNRGLNKAFQESKDFEEKLSWFETNLWKTVAVGHQVEKTTTNQEGVEFSKAPKEAVIPILENADRLNQNEPENAEAEPQQVDEEAIRRAQQEKQELEQQLQQVSKDLEHLLAENQQLRKENEDKSLECERLRNQGVPHLENADRLNQNEPENAAVEPQQVDEEAIQRALQEKQELEQQLQHLLAENQQLRKENEDKSLEYKRLCNQSVPRLAAQQINHQKNVIKAYRKHIKESLPPGGFIEIEVHRGGRVIIQKEAEEQ